MSGNAMFATARFKLATAAARISASSTSPARSGTPDDALASCVFSSTVTSDSVLLEQFRDHDACGGFDQSEVRERLREVTEVPGRIDVELFGVETERRRHSQQLLEQIARLLLLADRCQ